MIEKYLYQISTPNHQNYHRATVLTLFRFLEEDSFGVSLVKSCKFMAWYVTLSWGMQIKHEIHMITYILYHIHIVSIHYSLFPILYRSVLVLWKEENNPLDFSKKEGELKAQPCEETNTAVAALETVEQAEKHQANSREKESV